MERLNIKVSVIVPVYKAEDTLHRCIDSIIIQTLKEIEIVLVNDGSPDRSGIICDEYAKLDSRIKSFHKINGGASSARNFGMQLAQGEYVAFVDSDDYIESDMLSAMYIIAVDKNVDIVNCGHYYEKPNGKVEKFCTDFEKNKVLYRHDLVPIIHSSAYDSKNFHFVVRNIYRRKLFTDNKIFFNESIKYGEDTTFNLYSFYYAKSIYSTDEYFYHYVENRNGQIRAKYKDDYLAHLTTTFESWREFYKYIKSYDAQIMQSMHAKVIENFLISLLINAWNSPVDNFTRQLVLIRNSKIISESFLDYKAVGKLRIFSRCVVYLMKKRMYVLTSFIFYIRFFGQQDEIS